MQKKSKKSNEKKITPQKLSFCKFTFIIPIIISLLIGLLFIPQINSFFSIFHSNQFDKLQYRTKYKITCSEDYKINFNKECSPSSCSRIIYDHFITIEESKQLIQLIEKCLNISGGGSGPPSILDLHSGVVSQEDHFVDIYKLIASLNLSLFFERSEIELLDRIQNEIRQTIKSEFNLEKLYLTSPTFFSRITGGKKAITPNDEYWHVHVDKEQYGSFEYTGLLYLSEQNVNFKGGSFVFIGTEENKKLNQTVQPKVGRFLTFTSGAENPHHVQKILEGTRYALTISFTCDKRKAVTNFLDRAKNLVYK